MSPSRLKTYQKNNKQFVSPNANRSCERDKIRERQEQQEARAKAAIEARKLYEAARRTRMVPPTQIKQYDANTNGLIDLDEWQVYRADLARRTAEKRAARLAATKSASSSTAVFTNAPSPP